MRSTGLGDKQCKKEKEKDEENEHNLSCLAVRFCCSIHYFV